MIRPWVFEFFHAPGKPGTTEFDPAQSKAHFDRYLDLWASTERLGFEGVFFSEHHFGPAYSPSPNLLIAAIAGRTKKLRLGVMGMVLAYHQPWRIVEELGMLDHLTGGRLEIGTSAGIPQEMQRVGLSVAEARERYAEALEILDAGLRRPVLSHHGKFWSFESLHLRPRPLQQPTPPLWTTVVSTTSARKAAQRRSKITTGFHPVSRVKEIFDAYREEAARLGHDAGPEQLGLRRNVTLARTQNEAEANNLMVVEIVRAITLDDPRIVPSGGDQPVPDSMFTISKEEFIAGTPETVSAEILRQCREVGAGNFLSMINPVGGPERIAAQYEMYGAEVIPVLRAAGVA